MIDLSRRAKIAIALVAIFSVALLFFARRDYTKETQRLDTIVLKIVRACGVTDENFISGKQEKGKSGGHTFLKIIRRYEAGRIFSFSKFESEIENNLRGTDYKLVKSAIEKGPRKEDYTVYFSFKNRIIYEISFLKKKYRPLTKVKGAKISIVLDDFGYNMNNLDTLYGINTPLTISVLPNLPYSKRIAEEAVANNLEVILHLPLEPRGEKEHIEAGTIMVNMKPKEVKELLADAIASVPGARGISNHMGSRATEDRDLMKVIFDELKKRRLYFLDNVVTDESVCESVAERCGIRIAERSVFLDNESDEGYIENQMRRTAAIAAKTGSAIGVGHDRPYTVRVLARVIPELKNEGFQFVYLSELVK